MQLVFLHDDREPRLGVESHVFPVGFRGYSCPGNGAWYRGIAHYSVLNGDGGNIHGGVFVEIVSQDLDIRLAIRKLRSVDGEVELLTSPAIPGLVLFAANVYINIVNVVFYTRRSGDPLARKGAPVRISSSMKGGSSEAFGLKLRRVGISMVHTSPLASFTS